MINYDYDEMLNVIYAKPARQLTVSEMDDYAKRVAADPQVKDKFIEIVDFTQISKFEWSYAQSGEVMKLFACLECKQPLGSILLVKSSLQIGMARMIKSVFEPKIRIYIVNSLTDANMQLKKIRATQNSVNFA
ncbi:MAG: hypothetical protein KDD94_00055 [Calditrichaeota bacterium]|nr:hypothetical protein [Calditrichota bacterium]